MNSKRSSILSPMNRKVSPFGAVLLLVLQFCGRSNHAGTGNTDTQKSFFPTRETVAQKILRGITVFYFSVSSCHVDTAQSSLRNCTAKWLFHSLGLLSRELGKGVFGIRRMLGPSKKGVQE